MYNRNSFFEQAKDQNNIKVLENLRKDSRALFNKIESTTSETDKVLDMASAKLLLAETNNVLSQYDLCTYDMENRIEKLKQNNTELAKHKARLDELRKHNSCLRSENDMLRNKQYKNEYQMYRFPKDNAALPVPETARPFSPVKLHNSKIVSTYELFPTNSAKVMFNINNRPSSPIDIADSMPALFPSLDIPDNIPLLAPSLDEIIAPTPVRPVLFSRQNSRAVTPVERLSEHSKPNEGTQFHMDGYGLDYDIKAIVVK